MRISVRLTEKKLRTLDKTTACGVVRGLYVKVSKLKDGTLAKYFILRDRSVGRVFSLGAYPKMSLSPRLFVIRSRKRQAMCLRTTKQPARRARA